MQVKSDRKFFKRDVHFQNTFAQKIFQETSISLENGSKARWLLVDLIRRHVRSYRLRRNPKRNEYKRVCWKIKRVCLKTSSYFVDAEDLI